MKTAAINELKARLSDYLALVKAGSEVLITDRGNPIAYIVPISKSKKKRETLFEIEKQGLIKMGTGKLPKNFWDMPRAKDPKGQLLKALIEEREQDR